MLNVGIIGIGNTGNQVAVLANEKLRIPVMAVNSSERDLETVPNNISKYKIGKPESQGAGKNRYRAKTLLKDSIIEFISSDAVKEMLSKLDVVFIVSSTGGGTGSGTAPLMADVISKTFADVKTILVGVLPVNNEALSAHSNTLEYLEELYGKLPNQTYMLYDNDKLADIPSYKMMEQVNLEIVKDIDVLRCQYNLTTRFDSIDERDMIRLISFPGRIMVCRIEDLKEKDCDNKSIEDMLIDNIKKNCHVETQRDKKVAASGIITNLSLAISEEFNNHIPKVREFVGDPIHDFNHIYINEDRKLPNNVFLILSGLSRIDDKIAKINERVEEIQEKQKLMEDENMLSGIDITSLSNKVNSDETKPEDDTNSVDIKSIFSSFGV